MEAESCLFQNLDMYREIFHLSQNQLARDIGISSTLYKKQKQRHKLPPQPCIDEFYKRFANRIDIPIERLLFERLSKEDFKNMRIYHNTQDFLEYVSNYHLGIFTEEQALYAIGDIVRTAYDAGDIDIYINDVCFFACDYHYRSSWTYDIGYHSPSFKSPYKNKGDGSVNSKGSWEPKIKAKPNFTQKDPYSEILEKEDLIMKEISVIEFIFMLMNRIFPAILDNSERVKQVWIEKYIHRGGFDTLRKRGEYKASEKTYSEDLEYTMNCYQWLLIKEGWKDKEFRKK